MEHATGWYKRYTQYAVLLFAFVIAVGFNANTFSVVDKLAVDADASAAVVKQATDFVNSNRMMLYDSVFLKSPNLDSVEREKIFARIESLQATTDTLLKKDLSSLSENGLGIGWSSSGFFRLPPEARAKKEVGWAREIGMVFVQNILGWLVTMLAISLGAPFWFDLLKRFMHLRNAGVTPEDAAIAKK
jgi:hypothetical protein